MTFGKKLKVLRTARGLTLQELSKRSGVCVMALSKLERDINKKPRSSTVNKLSKSLEISVEELYNYAN